MKIGKCSNCGMSEYTQNGNVYTCAYCNAQYEEKEGVFKALLNFTERQLDKMRDAKKEKNENHIKQVNQRKQEKFEKELRKSRQKAHVCQYCGNHFKGFFKKTCSVCGVAKDY